MTGTAHHDYQAMSDMRSALRRFYRFSRDTLTPYRLTMEQYEVLLATAAAPAGEGPTIGQLSERLQVTHHTAVSLVEKLARRKLVRKKRNPVDRRHVHVQLSASGAKVLTAVAPRHRQAWRSCSQEMIKLLKELQR